MCSDCSVRAAKSCIVMAGFLLQEIINWRGPMLATWIQFWDHWSTTLLTGTVSQARLAGVYQIHADPTRNCWRQFRVQQSKESLSSFVSALTPFVTKFFPPKYLSFSKSIIRNFFQKFEIQIFSRTDKSIQPTVASTVPDQFLIWIWSESIKRNSHVSWTVDHGAMLSWRKLTVASVLIFDN